MVSVSIIGAGLMGRNLALLAARAGDAVRLYDIDAARAAAAAASVNDEIGHARATSVATLEDAAKQIDFLIEAVAENLSLKQDLFAQLDKLAPPEAILATNTSVLPITQITAKGENQARMVGTHFWNPPHLIPVVEVVRGKNTSTATMDRTVEILESFGKIAVRVEKDVPGFVGNRLQHALWREAIALVADGVCDAETVDLMARNTLGLRLGTMGPLENADYVGLDLTLAIHEAVLPDLNRDPHPSALLKQKVSSGELGAKSGTGFFDWPAGKRDKAAHRLSAHIARQLQDVSSNPPK